MVYTVVFCRLFTNWYMSNEYDGQRQWKLKQNRDNNILSNCVGIIRGNDWTSL